MSYIIFINVCLGYFILELFSLGLIHHHEVKTFFEKHKDKVCDLTAREQPAFQLDLDHLYLAKLKKLSQRD